MELVVSSLHWPDTTHPSKLHYPRSIITAPNSKHLNAFIFLRPINTHLSVNFPLAPFLQTIWTFTFSRFPTALTLGRGGRLMKGYTQRNMGETYDEVSQPSNHEAGHKRFRTAAAVTTRELPSVIKPPQVQSDAPVCLLAAPFFSHFSVPGSITMSLIFNPVPLVWSILLPEVHFSTSVFYLLSSFFQLSFFLSLLVILCQVVYVR